MGDLVRMPTARMLRARQRFGIATASPEHRNLAAIDEELREVENAIDALQKRRRGLLVEYRAKLRRRLPGAAI
jgi:hypothetical protein